MDRIVTGSSSEDEYDQPRWRPGGRSWCRSRYAYDYGYDEFEDEDAIHHHEIYDEETNEVELRYICDHYGKPIALKVPFEERDLVREVPYEDRDPDEDDFDGETATHTYSDTVIVIIPEDHVYDVFALSEGVQQTVLLDQIRYFLQCWQSGPLSEERKTQLRNLIKTTVYGTETDNGLRVHSKVFLSTSREAILLAGKHLGQEEALQLLLTSRHVLTRDTLTSCREIISSGGIDAVKAL